MSSSPQHGNACATAGSRLPRASRPLGRMARLRSAFTLIEAMIALAILSVGLLASAAALLNAFTVSHRSHSLMQAMYLAEQQIEAFHAMPGNDVRAVLLAPGYPNDPANPIDPDPTDGNQMQFVRRRIIQPNTPEVGMFTIVVQVDWVDQLGAVQTVSLQTMKADL